MNQWGLPWLGENGHYYPVLLPLNPHGKPIGDMWHDAHGLWFCHVPEITYKAGPFASRYDAELEACDAYERSIYMSGRYGR